MNLISNKTTEIMSHTSIIFHLVIASKNGNCSFFFFFLEFWGLLFFFAQSYVKYSTFTLKKCMVCLKSSVNESILKWHSGLHMHACVRRK